MSLLATPGLRGRSDEREALHGLLCDVRGGRSSVLVVRGEPGIGKTALLEDLSERAAGFTVIRGGGIESETELAFAGLQYLFPRMLEEGIDRLPEPQRAALRQAFGESAGGPPDPFLLGLAVLSRLADVAEERPLIVLVDDAQWLDRGSAQTLAFVARRLQAEAIGIVFAVREPAALFRGLRELVVPGLPPSDARALLASVMPGPFDESVRERFIAETHGNPLALLELPRSFSIDELAGGFARQDLLSVSGQVEESFQRRIGELPAATRLLLLIAAAEFAGDPVPLWRAADQLGVTPEAADLAETAGLIEFGTRVVFRHPLVRSAAYQTATPAERRRVHRALWQASDPDADPDRAAWHRALAAAAPDEGVADQLERSADRANARGGLAAAAAFLERAVALTPDSARRGPRALAAAEAKLAAGAPDAAIEMLSVAQASALDEFGRARLDLVRAQIAQAVNRGSDAPPLLLKAAKRLERVDMRLARGTYVQALMAAAVAGRFAGGAGMAAVAAAAPPLTASLEPANPGDLLLDGWVQALTMSYGAGVSQLGRALQAFRNTQGEELVWHLPACNTAIALWDYEAWRELSARHVELARATGALTWLPLALKQYADPYVHAGELAGAELIVEEIKTVEEATGIFFPPMTQAVLAAFRGRELEATGLVRAGIEDAVNRGDGLSLTYFHWVTAYLSNSLGRYEDAVDAAEMASAYPGEVSYRNWALVELIEAAARTGRLARGAEALEQLAEMTRASGTHWALGVEARSRALLCDGEEADRLYVDAIEHLEQDGVRVELARARLLYGEWLRRAGRRVDARRHLRTAYGRFVEFGCEALSARAARELAATGERVRTRTIEAADPLTPQESQIARLAATGRSNREIGEELFISHRTVGYHLAKVFAKLEIRNRAQLNEALQASPGTTSLAESGLTS
jgi:DNA-binding CsgD family transcriptional regulator